MIELTALEKAVLEGKAADKPRAALAKAELEAAKQEAARKAEKAEAEAKIKTQVDDQANAISQQIAAEVTKLLEPLTGYETARPPLAKHLLLAHLQSLEQAQAAVQQRNSLEQALSNINQRIDALAADKAAIADKIRQTGQDPETLGRLGVAMMDLDVLEGIRQKHLSEMTNLPEPTTNSAWLADWDKSVRASHEAALLELSETCAGIIRGVMRGLMKIDAQKYRNHAYIIQLEKLP